MPDFRNLGVLLRILLLTNLLALGTVVIQQADTAALPAAMLEIAGILELPLFLIVLALYAANPILARMSYPFAVGTVLLLVSAAVSASFTLLGDGQLGALARWLLWAIGAAGLVLAYFDYRSQRFSPSLTEARLLALTARIRPHFLFNTLNGVLGVIRSDPKRAERALEELADLFRAMMQDNRELVPLADELALCDRYLDLETLRLGDRLEVIRSIDEGVTDALIPPLMLQPLLENAVYHGVEPAIDPEPVRLEIRRVGLELHVLVENSVLDLGEHQSGNRMAMENIRERLTLFFDLEAQLVNEIKYGRYRVVIRLPIRT